MFAKRTFVSLTSPALHSSDRIPTRSVVYFSRRPVEGVQEKMTEANPESFIYLFIYLFKYI